MSFFLIITTQKACFIIASSKLLHHSYSIISSHLISAWYHPPSILLSSKSKQKNAQITTPPNLLNRNLRISRRIHNQHTRNRRTRQRRNNTRNKCRQRDFGDTTCLTGCEGREHTDLDTDGRDVTETADGVGGDEAGTFRELEEFVGWVLVGECCELFTFIRIRFLRENKAEEDNLQQRTHWPQPSTQSTSRHGRYPRFLEHRARTQWGRRCIRGSTRRSRVGH